MPEQNAPFTASWCADIADEVVKAFEAKFPKEVAVTLDEETNAELFRELIVETFRQVLNWRHFDHIDARRKKEHDEEMKQHLEDRDAALRMSKRAEQLFTAVLKDMGLKVGVALTPEQRQELKERLEKMGEGLPEGDPKGT